MSAGPDAAVHVGSVEHARTAADDEWAPLVVDGTQVGEVLWVRDPSAGGPGVGFWRSREDIVYDYLFESAEHFHVLEGSQRLALDDGRVVETKEGDCASFPKGMRCRAELRAPFLEFFVMDS